MLLCVNTSELLEADFWPNSRHFSATNPPHLGDRDLRAVLALMVAFSKWAEASWQSNGNSASHANVSKGQCYCFKWGRGSTKWPKEHCSSQALDDHVTLDFSAFHLGSWWNLTYAVGGPRTWPLKVGSNWGFCFSVWVMSPGFWHVFIRDPLARVKPHRTL